MTRTLTRRSLVQGGLLAAVTVSFGPGFWRNALAATPAVPGPSPYGPLRPPDANGIRLPAGFSSRVIAQADRLVDGTTYPFPWFPDGSATFATPDGGWILVVNSEIPLVGGVSAIRFDASGTIVAAQRILGGTSTNCAGGPTPWGTWLSCEEVDNGTVWECDPTGANDAVEHPAMGVFKHEAVCVDPVGQRVYLSEDIGDGGLYRYTPDVYPDLGAGLLEIACVRPSGRVIWAEVPDPLMTGGTATKDQVAAATTFARGEGIWFDSGIVYLATTSDETIHAYDTRSETIGVLYNADAADAAGSGVSPLRGVDNVMVSRSGDLFVCEDSYEDDPDAMDVCLITPDRLVSRFLKLTGDEHFLGGELTSETVGLAFSPDGSRLYFGSQRAGGFGKVYEVTGPFRTERPGGTTPGGGAPGVGAPAAPEPPVVFEPAGADSAAPAPATAPSSTAPTGPATTPPVRVVPLGVEATRRLTIPTFTRRGLAVGLTVDAPAKLTLTLRANGDVLARAVHDLTRGRANLRLKPSKAIAARLRERRRPLTATLEIRLQQPGAAAVVTRRTVTLRPA